MSIRLLSSLAAATTLPLNSEERSLSPLIALWLALPAAVLLIARFGPLPLKWARRRVGPGDSRSLMVVIIASGVLVTLSTQMFYMQAHSLTNLAGVPSRDLVLVSILSDLAGAAVMLVLTVVLRTDGLNLLGISWSNLRSAAPRALLYLLMLYPVVYLVGDVSQRVWQRLDNGDTDEHELIKMLEDKPSKSLEWLIVVSATLAAPIAEELIFRGYLQTVVRESPAPAWMAILFSSLAFTAIHQPPEIQPMIFVLAVGLGYIYERTGNLAITILMHAVFNGLNIYLTLH